MDKKERLFRAIRLQPVDRPPTTYRGHEYISKKLLDYFNIENPDNLQINNKELIHKLNCDFWSSGSKIGKFATFMPGYKGPEPEEPYIKDNNMFYTLGINSILGKFKGYDVSYPNIGIDPPLKGIDHASELKKGFLTEKLDFFDFNSYHNKYESDSLKYENILNDEDYVVSLGTLNSPFMTCIYLRGMDKFLMDLMINKELAELIVGEVSDFCVEFNRRELEYFGDKAEYYGSWDDVADQSGLMFQPELFKKHFLPIYEKLIANVKKHDLMFGWHCCGNVTEFMPWMIEAGIDVFDVVQTSARNMDIDSVYDMCAGKVCLHGTVDVQKILAFGTPKEIENYVKRVLSLWGNKGGIIIAPSHETVPGTSLENILAIYNAINNVYS